VYYRDLADARGRSIPLLDDFDADYDFIANDGPVFFFKTDLEAPRSRVIAIDVTKPGRANWREIISQSDDALRGVNFVNEQFICNYLHDAHSRVASWRGMEKTPRAKLVREVRTAGDRLRWRVWRQARGLRDVLFFHQLHDAEHNLPARSGDGEKQRLSPAEGRFRFGGLRDEAGLYSEQGRHACADVHHASARSETRRHESDAALWLRRLQRADHAAFDIERLVWMEMGGVYAVANLRGGGEYGAPWHLAGTKGNKQNVFDDFIAAAEWLIANGYTSSAKLAIQGRSNGGLLVGAALTQRPELFGAALPVVGVLDMLRFHKFTIGWAWKSDYGSSDNADEFPALFAYSPLHRLQPGTRYPATLITTGDHDDRVVPAHSFKFAARLQECQATDGPPVLIRIETKAGHGAGKPIAKEIEEEADQMAFLVRALGIEAK
jgi:prolyl oligopeptidase